MTPEKTARRLQSFLKAEIVRARRRLQKAGHQNAGAPIHDTRKTIKKLRAALRLAAEMTEPDLVEAVALPLREAAHRLGPLRDERVLATTAAALRKQGETPLPAPPASTTAAPLLREARAHLRSAEAALRRLLKVELNPKGVKRGLQLLYHHAQRAMHRAGKKSNDESLHAWRRRTKDLYYMLDVVDAPARYVKQVKRLTEFLGDDHDLAFFAQHYASPAELKAHRALFKRLRKKRVRLQEKALRLGERVLHDRARKLVARLLK